MDKKLLEGVITDQHAIELTKGLVMRTIYAKIAHLKKSKQIVIITGLRRSGKSILLGQLRSDSREQDYYLNFDDDRLVNFTLKDFQLLYEIFIEMYGEQKTFYFDEIQNIEGWERFVRRLHNEGHKIYVTGSNASMLSAELGTRLTGRYVEIDLYPYSFLEYLDYKKRVELSKKMLTTVQKGEVKSLFNEYMEYGGLPEYLESKHHEYLHTLYESIIYRDVIVRHNIKNHRALKELVFYIASNIGKECSFNSLKKTLGLSSATTVSDYCTYLQDTYLCYFINRFDYSLKKQMQYAKKVYFIDQALAVNVGFRFSKDQGRLLENIVFIELLRRGYEVFFHNNKKECDFVLRDGNNIVEVIQVCVEMSNDSTRNREISGLVDAMESYKLESGLIITLDQSSSFSEQVDEKSYNIEVVPIWSWLLDNV